MLSTFQEAGRERPELGFGIRSFPVERYVIFCRIITKGIEIIRVLHGSRDIEQVFTKQPSQPEENKLSEE